MATTTIAPVARVQRAIVRSDIDVNVLCDAVTDAVDHPLAGVLRAAASGAFPQVDGLAELVRRTPPGNAASLRELIARGFRPIGSEVLIEVSAAGT